MKAFYKASFVVLSILSIGLMLGSAEFVRAATSVDLGRADGFAVLAGSTITNTGASVITGDLGLSPGTAVTGFPPGTVSGTQHVTDTSADNAQIDLTTAYNNAAGQTPVSTVPTELGGTTKTAGIYDSADGTFGITGTLTLDALGDPNAVFIFKTASTLITAGSSNVTLANGAQACNVFWQVGSSATLGANSTFTGNILALTSVTLTTGASVNGRVLARNGAVTLDTNTITAATCATTHLIVIKDVVNNNGGTGVAGDYSTTITGVTTATPTASGAEAPGVDNVLTSVGTYSVDEGAHVGYDKSLSADCSGTIAVGETKTCTITNDDIASDDDIASESATLHIVKSVINNNGGTASASAFTIGVTGTNVSDSSFAGSATGVDVTLDAGSYSVTETTAPGYLGSGSADCSGTIAAGETKTCTITNNDIAPQLIVNKIVVNNDGGTKAIANFSLLLDGVSVKSGVTTATSVGRHTVSETSVSGYKTTIGGNCATNGTITLALGDVKTCTITNNDIAALGGGAEEEDELVPPLIDVVKVPNPLYLPDGSGSVTYTYTLRNTGTVPVTDVTMVGDTCSPILLISGDNNADAKLDVSETWTYRCTTTLSETHTNIVTATGWANGISATDTATATVIVGLSVVPPLIHVEKVPSPLTLSEGGGAVTYTYTVTNPGTEPLSDVSITDDKCTGLPSRVTGHPGDVNKNDLLESSETWSFTCQSTLTQTTTNTGTVVGSANGLTASDSAIATVVVEDTAIATGVGGSAPGLPNTGLRSGWDHTLWKSIAPIGIAAVLGFLFFARRKQII